MTRFIQRRGVRRTLVTAVTLAVLLAAACAFFGVRSKSDIVAYLLMPRECHSVWRPLALRLIRAGQPVTDVIRSHKPRHVHKWDRFTLLAYNDTGDFTGLAILAKDDKLVMARANSCTWQHTFFCTLPKNEVEAISKSFWEWFKEQRAKGRSQSVGGDDSRTAARDLRQSK